MENSSKLSPEIENLHKRIKESGLHEKIQKLCGFAVKPQFKRLLVTPIEWDALPLSSSGLVLANYVTSKAENERAERENSTFTLTRFMIVAVADDCRPEFIPGMEFLAMDQTKMGYTTKMSIPHADGEHPGSGDYYHYNEHDVMSIILEDRTIAQRKNQEEVFVPVETTFQERTNADDGKIILKFDE